MISLLLLIAMFSKNFTIELKKDSFKFSSSHFTIFSAKKAERLHGHNYYVTAKISFDSCNPESQMAHDFHSLKKDLQVTCDYFDEYVLIPKHSPFSKLKLTQKQVQYTFANKSYSFPKTDVRILNSSNITCESLAQTICEVLFKKWQKIDYFSRLEVQIEETRGQSVSYSLSENQQGNR